MNQQVDEMNKIFTHALGFIAAAATPGWVGFLNVLFHGGDLSSCLIIFAFTSAITSIPVAFLAVPLFLIIRKFVKIYWWVASLSGLFMAL